MSQYGQGNSQWSGGNNPWNDDGTRQPVGGGPAGGNGGGSGNGGFPMWAIVLMIVLVMFFIGCCGCCGVLGWFGSVTPDTWAYSSTEVPAAYVQTAEDVGALEPGEVPDWFYSDGITDVREGFYLVTPEKVVVYKEDAVTPLTIVPMDDIMGAQLNRDTSFFVDSMITLVRRDGTTVTFPMSSERDGDEAFFKVIEDNMAGSD